MSLHELHLLGTTRLGLLESLRLLFKGATLLLSTSKVFLFFHYNELRIFHPLLLYNLVVFGGEQEISWRQGRRRFEVFRLFSDRLQTIIAFDALEDCKLQVLDGFLL